MQRVDAHMHDMHVKVPNDEQMRSNCSPETHSHGSKDLVQTDTSRWAICAEEVMHMRDITLKNCQTWNGTTNLLICLKYFYVFNPD
jgi:hypothetical protein